MATLDEPILRFFAFEHLPEGPLQDASSEFSAMACWVIDHVPRSPVRTVALRKLLEAKDAAVRATLPDIPAEVRERADLLGTVNEDGTRSKQATGKLGLPVFRSHKKVSAARIDAVDTTGATPHLVLDGGRHEAVSPDWIDKHDPRVGGYFVVYDDAYTSYSPAKAFEEGYTAVFEASP